MSSKYCFYYTIMYNIVISSFFTIVRHLVSLRSFLQNQVFVETLVATCASCPLRFLLVLEMCNITLQLKSAFERNLLDHGASWGTAELSGGDHAMARSLRNERKQSLITTALLVTAISSIILNLDQCFADAISTIQNLDFWLGAS